LVAAVVLVGCGGGSAGGDDATVGVVDEAPTFADCSIATTVFDMVGSPSDAAESTAEAGTDDAEAIAAAVDRYLASRLTTFGATYPDAPAPYDFVEVAPGDDESTRHVNLVDAEGAAVLDITLEPYDPTGWRVAHSKACQDILERFNPGDGSESSFAEVEEPEG
jgi:hypothetical protein